MTVAELIEALQRQEPTASVVLWDQTGCGEHVCKLRPCDVRAIQLGRKDCNGLLLFQAWDAGDAQLQGPYAGVVLGPC